MTTDPFIHELMTLPIVRDARLSPDGSWAAFTWFRVHENVDVFAVPTDGSRAPISLTHTPEYTQLVSWTPDGRAVIVAEDHDGDERACLYRVNLDQPGVMQPLTEARPPYFIRGGSLHPDGQSLFYGANFDFSSGHAIEPTWLYRHDLRTGERKPIARPERPIYMAVNLNRAGTHVLYPRHDDNPAGRQYYLVDVDGYQDREILNFGEAFKIVASWLPDSEHILVLSESIDGRPQEHYSLGVYHWPTGQMHWLIDDPARRIEGAWAAPDGTIVVDEVLAANHVPSFISNNDWKSAFAGRQPVASSPFPRLPGNLIPLGRGADGAWIALYYASTAPVELVRFRDGASSPDDLTSLTHAWEHTQLAPQQLTAAEAFSWLSVDNLPIHGWLYRAQPNPGRALIYVHGGPTSHSEDALNAQLQYFVSKGFNVLDVNYRGSTGYGLKFREAIKEDGWGGREQADIASGAEALIRSGLAETGRVGVTGTSYGGYSAWHLITHYPPELIGAAAPICGMTDLRVDYETTRPDIRPLSEEMIGGRPDQIPEKYAERSPINFVQNIRGRLLIVQGAQDPNVSPENVRQVIERLEKYHIPYQVLTFDDEGHGIIKPANQETLYADLAGFFAGALS